MTQTCKHVHSCWYFAPAFYVLPASTSHVFCEAETSQTSREAWKFRMSYGAVSAGDLARINGVIKCGTVAGNCLSMSQQFSAAHRHHHPEAARRSSNRRTWECLAASTIGAGRMKKLRGELLAPKHVETVITLLLESLAARQRRMPCPGLGEDSTGRPLKEVSSLRNQGVEWTAWTGVNLLHQRSIFS